MLVGHSHACLNARIHSCDTLSNSAPVQGTTPAVARNIDTMPQVTASSLSSPLGIESAAARAMHRFSILAIT